MEWELNTHAVPRKFQEQTSPNLHDHVTTYVTTHQREREREHQIGFVSFAFWLSTFPQNQPSTNFFELTPWTEKKKKKETNSMWVTTNPQKSIDSQKILGTFLEFGTNRIILGDQGLGLGCIHMYCSGDILVKSRILF